MRNLNLGLSYLITTYLQVVVEPYHHPFQNDEFLDLTNYLCPEAIEKTWPQLKLGSEKVHHTSLFWLTFCKSMEEFCQQHRSFCKNKVYYQVKTFSNWKDRRNIKVLDKLQACRKRGGRGGARAPPVFVRSVNHILTIRATPNFQTLRRPWTYVYSLTYKILWLNCMCFGSSI